MYLCGIYNIILTIKEMCIMSLAEIKPTSIQKRHYFACYSAKGEEHFYQKQIADVLAFSCPITRDNWIEITNKNAANLGKSNVAFKVSAPFIRKSILHFEKGDEFKFEPIKPDSIFYLADLADKTYFLTEIIRNP